MGLVGTIEESPKLKRTRTGSRTVPSGALDEPISAIYHSFVTVRKESVTICLPFSVVQRGFAEGVQSTRGNDRRP